MSDSIIETFTDTLLVLIRSSYGAAGGDTTKMTDGDLEQLSKATFRETQLASKILYTFGLVAMGAFAERARRGGHLEISDSQLQLLLVPLARELLTHGTLELHKRPGPAGPLLELAYDGGEPTEAAEQAIDALIGPAGYSTRSTADAFASAMRGKR